jgi:2-methylcitrate dehydratase PrpD
VALRLAREERVESAGIAAIRVRASSAALNYPGCNATGPFERVLQAKMSIQYCVAATLVTGAIEEANYRLLKDPAVMRLIGATTLDEGAEFTTAYPGRQGTEVIVTLADGRTVTRRLEDVVPATAEQIRARFEASCEAVLGSSAMHAIESTVDSLERQEDAGALSRLLLKIGQEIGA